MERFVSSFIITYMRYKMGLRLFFCLKIAKYYIDAVIKLTTGEHKTLRWHMKNYTVSRICHRCILFFVSLYYLELIKSAYESL